MRAKEFVVAAAAVSAYPWLPLDHHNEDFRATFSVFKTGTGDVTYAVQATLSNLETGGLNVAVVSAKAYDLVSATGNIIHSLITSPVVAIRLNITAVSGAAGLNMNYIQSGN